MSIRLMSIVWDIPSWPTQSALLVALKLADYANDDGGNVFPARNKLAAHAHTSLATVKRILQAFRDCGLLVVVRQGGNGPRDTTEYEINVALLMQLHDGYKQFKKDASKLEIEDATVVEDGENKGLTVSPLISTRGSNGELRGSSDEKRGSMGEPQSTSIDPPNRNTTSRASAQENSNFENKSAARSAIRLTPGDGAEWRAWIDHIRQSHGDTAAERAERGGQLTVSSRWPSTEGARLLGFTKPKAPHKDITSRITGDRA